MGRSEEVWGKDSWEFRPSRWIDDEGKLKKETQWVAHWFNGGYRLVRLARLSLRWSRLIDRKSVV